MNFKLFLFVFFLFTITKAHSSSSLDSIGVENNNGKKVILHKIAAKETYYGLGRQYKLSPHVIMDFNNNIILQPSAIIKIPTQQDFFIQQLPPKIEDKKTKDIAKTSIYKVKPGETLYGIAKNYNVSIEILKSLNGLRSTALSIGQEIKVPINEPIEKEKVPPILEVKNEVKEIKINLPKDTVSIIDSTENSNLEIPRNKYGITEMNDKGLALWLDGDNLDESKSYALHKTAPIGTVIRITNPMSNKSVFAKVVGKFTDNDTTKDVIIVISRTSAEAIGAIDKRFLVTITFGIPNEQ